MLTCKFSFLMKYLVGLSTERELMVTRFAFSDGFNSSPLPFPCSIKPRSSAHAEVIQQELQDALESLKTYTAVTNKVS